MRGRARGLIIDIAPLRLDHDYRLLWLGQVVGGIGNQVTRLALPFQVFVLTNSTLAIAALTAVQLVPILVFVVAAGSVIDAVDRRRLLLITQVGLALCSLALLGLALVPKSAADRDLRHCLRRRDAHVVRPAGPVVVDPATRPGLSGCRLPSPSTS